MLNQLPSHQALQAAEGSFSTAGEAEPCDEGTQAALAAVRKGRVKEGLLDDEATSKPRLEGRVGILQVRGRRREFPPERCTGSTV